MIPASRSPTVDERFRQAALTYLAYGSVYWVVAVYLEVRVFAVAPRLLIWFLVGAAIAAGVPWLLWRRRAWFERWILSRRDFARILAVLVAIRVLVIAYLATQGPERLRMPRVGGGIPPTPAGAWLMAAIAAVTAGALARAAWAREQPQ